MALTRKFLSALGIEDAQADEIIEAHTSTVNGIKIELEKYKGKVEKLHEAEEKAEMLEKVQKELDELKASMEKNDKEREEFKSKYEQTKKEYDDYKESVKTKEEKDVKTKAFKDILKEANISEKRFDAIIKLSDEEIEKIAFEEDGSVKDKENVLKSVTENWSEYVQNTQTQGANTSTPPANNGGADKRISRAKQIAQQYHDDLYGKVKED